MFEPSFVTHVRELLGSLKGVSCRAMFGGHGLFANNTMFGIIYEGRLFLRTNGQLAASERAAGLLPFQPRPGVILGAYIEVPDDLLDDGEALCIRARDAMTPTGRRGVRAGHHHLAQTVA